MTFNARNPFLALLLVFCVASADADELVYRWGYYWNESTYLGKCHPSLKEYVDPKHELPDYDDYRVYKPLRKGEVMPEDYDFESNRSIENTSGIYTLLIDNTPPKNPPQILFRKENDGRQCIIMLVKHADSVSIDLNKDGSLPDEFQTNANFAWGFPDIKITFRLDKEKGFYEPHECRWTWWYANIQTGREDKVPCDLAFDDVPYWVPPDMPNSIYFLVDTDENETKYNGVDFGSPSFDCALAHTWIEKTICANAELSTLDTRIDMRYERIKANSYGDKRQQFIDDQRAWLKQRNACKTDKCLIDAYIRRIDGLCAKYPASCQPHPSESGR